MAIIRKGDKVAEAKLRERAAKQPRKSVRYTEKDPQSPRNM